MAVGIGANQTMGKLDIIRSLLREGADIAKDKLERLTPAETLKDALRDLKNGRARISDEQLCAVVTRVTSLSSAHVACAAGAIHIDAGTDSGPLVFSVKPVGVSFAPQGAKELSFKISPAESTKHLSTSPIVSALAGSIAAGLWGAALSQADQDTLCGAFVERNGLGQLRVDLRSVPAVRALQRKPALALMTEVMELAEIHVEEGGLLLRFKMPMMP